jgi:hypothetical protein
MVISTYYIYQCSNHLSSLAASAKLLGMPSPCTDRAAVTITALIIGAAHKPPSFPSVRSLVPLRQYIAVVVATVTPTAAQTSHGSVSILQLLCKVL